MLQACQTTDPKDLQLESLGAAKLSELPGVWNAVQARSDVRSGAITLLKIHFSSKSDFVKLSKADALHFSYRMFACEAGNLQGPPFFVLPDLRIRGDSVEIGPYLAYPDLERFRGSNGRLNYEVLMPIAGVELNRLFGSSVISGQPTYFNPSAYRGDICLQVTAAAMWFGHTLESNVMRIPALEIVRLIE